MANLTGVTQSVKLLKNNIGFSQMRMKSKMFKLYLGNHLKSSCEGIFLNTEKRHFYMERIGNPYFPVNSLIIKNKKRPQLLFPCTFSRRRHYGISTSSSSLVPSPQSMPVVKDVFTSWELAPELHWDQFGEQLPESSGLLLDPKLCAALNIPLVSNLA